MIIDLDILAKTGGREIKIHSKFLTHNYLYVGTKSEI